MLKKLVIVMLVVCCGAVLMRAQDEFLEDREIYTVLSYGDDVFEPELWLASAAESAVTTTATWNSPTYGALSYLDYRHYDDGITTEEIDALFDNTFFEANFANYATWRKTAVCYSGDLTLHEFELSNGDLLYNMRYWIAPAEENTRVSAHFIVFPNSYLPELDGYAEQLYPELPVCE
jgi:hypothetical protein